MKAQVKIKAPEIFRPKREIDLRTRALARQAGRILRDEIRKQIPAGSGKVGRWPSCMATGALQSAVVMQEPIKRNNKWHVRVGIQKRRRAARYARIHEKGGVITPKTKPRMVFVIPPQCVKNAPVKKKRGGKGGGGTGNVVIPLKDGSLLIIATHVQIREKRYFEKGWSAGRRRIISEIGISVKGHAIR